MRTEQELRAFLDKCHEVCTFTLSNGPCPLNDDGRKGCCAECSFPSAIQWVLSELDCPVLNGQEMLIEMMKHAGD